jgi:hypothetical protein
VGNISTPVYIPISSPGNVIDGEGVNNLKINFRDYAELLNHWLEVEKWPQ